MVLGLNEYVRTKNGIIAKVIGVQSGGIEKYYFDKEVIDNFKELTQIGAENVVVKHSFNIIDLIEEGDYVNGQKAVGISSGWIDTKENVIRKDHIKTILTKEQFKAMEYEVK